MGEFYPGINEPIKPLKLPLTQHQYYDEGSPSFRRDNPTVEGQLWLDTKVNYLNEIMKFLPRETKNQLIDQGVGKKNIKSKLDRNDVAESVYNREIFKDADIGLWKGTQSKVLDKLFSKTGELSDFSRFAGLLGLPFDGHLGLGTYIVDDENNIGRPVEFLVDEGEDEDDDGDDIYYMEYENKQGLKHKLNLTTATADDLIPIIKDLKGDSYAKDFREGVNFHATILDFQNTNVTYDNSENQFVVDANGDGYADLKESSAIVGQPIAGKETQLLNFLEDNSNYTYIDSTGKLTVLGNMKTADVSLLKTFFSGADAAIDLMKTNSGADSLSTTSLNTSLYQTEYLQKLGIYTPVLDYSDVFSSFMADSMFNTARIDRTYNEADRETYDKLHVFLEDETMNDASKFGSFLNKIKFEISKVDGEGSPTTTTAEADILDYTPNIYELARKGVDLSNVLKADFFVDSMGKTLAQSTALLVELQTAGILDSNNKIKDNIDFSTVALPASLSADEQTKVRSLLTKAYWSDSDVFYFSMLMMEAKRRYTYAMSTIFGVQSTKPDIKDVLKKYADPDIWECSEEEDYLYFDVLTASGRYERMYNYFIPKDVGETLTDPIDKKIEKLNWINKRAIEYLTNQSTYELYQDSLNRALHDNYSALDTLRIEGIYDDDATVPTVIKDFNKMLQVTESIVTPATGRLNETQLAQTVSLFKEVKDWLITQVPDSEKESISYSKDDAPYSIYYVTDGATSTEAQAWKKINDYITKINDTAGEIILLRDEASSKIFVKDRLSSLTDFYSTNIYKKSTTGTIVTIVPDEDLKNVLINNIVDTNRYYFLNYRSKIDTYGNAKASAEMEKIVDISFNVSNNTGDMFAILSDTVNKQAKMYNDMNIIDKFNYIQYGTVRTIYKGEDPLTQKNINTNLFEEGILDIGYFPERIAKTTAKAPYLSERRTPENAASLDGEGNARYQTNMLDKMYFSMIAEMQKMNNFYMMMMFASPTDTNYDGVIDDDDKISELFFSSDSEFYYNDVAYNSDNNGQLYTPYRKYDAIQTVSGFSLGENDSYKAVSMPSTTLGDPNNTIFKFLDNNPTKRVELDTAMFSPAFDSIFNSISPAASATRKAFLVKAESVNGNSYYDIQFNYKDTSASGSWKGFVYRIGKNSAGNYVDVGFTRANMNSAQLTVLNDPTKLAAIAAFTATNTKYSYNNGKLEVSGSMTTSELEDLKLIFIDSGDRAILDALKLSSSSGNLIVYGRPIETVQESQLKALVSGNTSVLTPMGGDDAVLPAILTFNVNGNTVVGRLSSTSTFYNGSYTVNGVTTYCKITPTSAIPRTYNLYLSKTDGYSYEQPIKFGLIDYLKTLPAGALGGPWIADIAGYSYDEILVSPTILNDTTTATNLGVYSATGVNYSTYTDEIKNLLKTYKVAAAAVPTTMPTYTVDAPPYGLLPVNQENNYASLAANADVNFKNLTAPVAEAKTTALTTFLANHTHYSYANGTLTITDLAMTDAEETDLKVIFAEEPANSVKITELKASSALTPFISSHTNYDYNSITGLLSITGEMTTEEETALKAIFTATADGTSLTNLKTISALLPDLSNTTLVSLTDSIATPALTTFLTTHTNYDYNSTTGLLSFTGDMTNEEEIELHGIFPVDSATISANKPSNPKYDYDNDTGKLYIVGGGTISTDDEAFLENAFSHNKIFLKNYSFTVNPGDLSVICQKNSVGEYYGSITAGTVTTYYKFKLSGANYKIYTKTVSYVENTTLTTTTPVETVPALNATELSALTAFLSNPLNSNISYGTTTGLLSVTGTLSAAQETSLNSIIKNNTWAIGDLEEDSTSTAIATLKQSASFSQVFTASTALSGNTSLYVHLANPSTYNFTIGGNTVSCYKASDNNYVGTDSLIASTKYYKVKPTTTAGVTTYNVYDGTLTYATTSSLVVNAPTGAGPYTFIVDGKSVDCTLTGTDYYGVYTDPANPSEPKYYKITPPVSPATTYNVYLGAISYATAPSASSPATAANPFNGTVSYEDYDVLENGIIGELLRDNEGNIVESTDVSTMPSPIPTPTATVPVVTITDPAIAVTVFSRAGISTTTYTPTAPLAISPTDWSITVTKYGSDNLLYEIKYNINTTPVTKSVLTDLSGSISGTADGSAYEAGIYGYRYNFLDPLKSSVDSLNSDESVFLDSTGLFKASDKSVTRSMLKVGLATENTLVESMDELATSIFGELATQLISQNIFHEEGAKPRTFDGEDGEQVEEDAYKIELPATSGLTLTSPFDVLDEKFTTYLVGNSNFTSGSFWKVDDFKDKISVFCTQVLIAELEDKGVINSSGNIIDANGVVIDINDTDFETKVNVLVESAGLSPLFSDPLRILIVKEGLNNIIEGNDYQFSTNENEQERATEQRTATLKRAQAKNIIVGAVKEDYKQIKSFVSGFYNRMSAINFNDALTTADNTDINILPRTGLRPLDFTLNTDTTEYNNTAPVWMGNFYDDTTVISLTDLNSWIGLTTEKNALVKEILINEGIILGDDTSGYTLLQGIDPRKGLGAFEVLIRGYEVDNNGIKTLNKVTREDLFGTAKIVENINKNLLGFNDSDPNNNNYLWHWLNKVKNLEYNAFSSKLKVNSKDTLLSLFVSKDFVRNVKEIQKVSSAGGFGWVDGPSPNYFTGAELGGFWQNATRYSPLMPDLAGGTKAIDTVVSPSDAFSNPDIINYKDLDLLAQVVEILETKWWVQNKPAGWLKANSAAVANSVYTDAVENNSVFTSAASADWGVMTSKIDSLFDGKTQGYTTGSISKDISFNSELSNAIDSIKSSYVFNFTEKYTATYKYTDGDGNEHTRTEIETASKTTTANANSSGKMGFTKSIEGSYNFPATKTYEVDGEDEEFELQTPYLKEQEYTGCSYSAPAYIANNDGYENVWARGTWGGDLAGAGYNYLPNGNKLTDEFARDFINLSNLTNQLKLSDFSGDGVISTEEASMTLYDALHYIRDRANANIAYLNMQLDKFNSYASQIKEMLDLGSGDVSNKGFNSLEELFKKEFYMQDNFNPLILGSEFQSRFVEGALVSEDWNIASDADVYSMTDQIGWYETAGRVAVNSSTPTITKKMDFAKFNYTMSTDYNKQYSTLKGKMTAMKYSGSQGKDNMRSKMERAVRDDFNRTLIFDDLVFSHSANTSKSFSGSDIQVRVYTKSGAGVKVDDYAFIQGLATIKNSENNPAITYFDADEVEDDKIITIDTEVMATTTYADFQVALSGIAGISEAQLKQIYDFFKNIGWNNVAVGANLSAAHSIIELNSIYNEVIMSNVMTSIVNDELQREYDKRKADYDEQIAKKKEEEISEQIQASKRSEFKSYVKSLSRRR